MTPQSGNIKTVSKPFLSSPQQREGSVRKVSASVDRRMLAARSLSRPWMDLELYSCINTSWTSKSYAAVMLLIVHTFLSRVDSGNGSKRAFPFIVVNPDLDVKRWEGLDALVFKDVSGCFGRWNGGLHPTCGTVGSESHDVAEPWPIL